jgi:hypothetical protein
LVPKVIVGGYEPIVLFKNGGIFEPPPSGEFDYDFSI